jgi:hypothetical protein
MYIFYYIDYTLFLYVGYHFSRSFKSEKTGPNSKTPLSSIVCNVDHPVELHFNPLTTSIQFKAHATAVTPSRPEDQVLPPRSNFDYPPDATAVSNETATRSSKRQRVDVSPYQRIVFPLYEVSEYTRNLQLLLLRLEATAGVYRLMEDVLK